MNDDYPQYQPSIEKDFLKKKEQAAHIRDMTLNNERINELNKEKELKQKRLEEAENIKEKEQILKEKEELEERIRKTQDKSDELNLSVKNYKNYAHEKYMNVVMSSKLDNSDIYLIFGNDIKTYISTQNQEKNYIKLIFKFKLFVNKIVITGRYGDHAIKSRLVPMKLELTDKVTNTFKTKTFPNIYNSYVWEDINIFSDELIISNSKNYLEISNIKIYAKRDESLLKKYERDHEAIMKKKKQEEEERKQKEKSSQQIEKEKILAEREKKKKMREDKIKKIEEIKQKEKQEEAKREAEKRAKEAEERKKKLDRKHRRPLTWLEMIEYQKLAKEYDIMIAKDKEAMRPKAEKADKLMAIILKHQAEDEETTREAKQYGLPPPPLRYSQKQIDTVKEYMSHAYPKLDFYEKAMCMKMIDSINANNTASTKAGADANILPYKVIDAKKYKALADEELRKFNWECKGFTGMIFP